MQPNLLSLRFFELPGFENTSHKENYLNMANGVHLLETYRVWCALIRILDVLVV